MEVGTLERTLHTSSVPPLDFSRGSALTGEKAEGREGEGHTEGQGACTSLGRVPSPAWPRAQSLASAAALDHGDSPARLIPPRQGRGRAPAGPQASGCSKSRGGSF